MNSISVMDHQTAVPNVGTVMKSRVYTIDDILGRRVTSIEDVAPLTG